MPRTLLVAAQQDARALRRSQALRRLLGRRVEPARKRTVVRLQLVAAARVVLARVVLAVVARVVLRMVTRRPSAC